MIISPKRVYFHFSFAVWLLSTTAASTRSKKRNPLHKKEVASYGISVVLKLLSWIQHQLVFDSGICQGLWNQHWGSSFLIINIRYIILQFSDKYAAGFYVFKPNIYVWVSEKDESLYNPHFNLH